MKTLYVTDLDGTLLGPDCRVSTRSVELLRDVINRGALFTVATARTPATVEPLLAYLPATDVPAVVITGASLWERRSHRYLNPQLLPSDTAEAVRQAAARHGLTPFTYTLGRNGHLDVWRNGERSLAEQRFVDERTGLSLKQFHFDTPEGDKPVLPNTLLYFGMGSPEQVFPLADELRTRGDCAVTSYIDIYDSSTALFEVLAPRLNKARAIKRVAEMVGAERIVAFGDNLNDISMLEAADVSVAVANACPEAKAAAQIVVGSNADDAVARFIAYDYSINHG